jgi:hypothetical protein
LFEDELLVIVPFEGTLGKGSIAGIFLVGTCEGREMVEADWFVALVCLVLGSLRDSAFFDVLEAEDCRCHNSAGNDGSCC